MNSEKQNAGSSKDELLKTKTSNIELTESELGRASGGLSGIKGAALPSNHKDE